MILRKKGTIITLLCFLFVITLVVMGGCGKGTGQTREEKASPGGQQASPAKPEGVIKIGAVSDLSGPTMGVGTAYIEGFTTYIKWVNDQGGVNGRKIDLKVEDGKYDIQRDVSLYKRFREQGVLTVAHTWTTGSQSALGPEYIKDKNVVFPGSRAAFMFKPEVNPYIFLTSPSYDIGYYAMVDYAVEKTPGAKIVVVHPDNTYGQDAFKWLQERGKAKGAQVVSEILNFDAVDATTQAIHIKGLKPDFVFLVLSGRPTKTFLDAAQKVGLNMPMVANFNTAEQLLIELAGGLPVVKNITGVAFYATPAEDLPGMKQLLEVGKKYGIKQSRLFEQWYAMGWTDAMVLVEGLKRCGDTLTGEKLKESIESLRDFDTGGLTAPLTYGPKQHTGTGRIKYTRINLEKGYWEPISDWVEPKA